MLNEVNGHGSHYTQPGEMGQPFDSPVLASLDSRRSLGTGRAGGAEVRSVKAEARRRVG